LNEGDGFVSLGTSGVVLVARDSFRPAPETAVHTFCHAVPEKWYQMGVMLSATDSMNWLSRITGVSPKDLTDALGSELQAPGRVRFLPYLSGERTPHNDAQIRGGFTGLSTSTDRTDLTRAVLEGVCFGLRDSLEALKSTGAKIDSLTAIGGGSASEYWLRLLATVLGVPLKLPAGREFGAALGAARLAIIAADGAPPQEVVVAPETQSVIHPVEDLRSAYDDAYASFRNAYPGMKDIQ
jgi:xylulokinase